MVSKINSIILLIIVFIFSSCSSSYNKPFINTDETIKLRENISEEMVLKEIGHPLYVKSGDLNSNEVIWVYEVRTILIKSDQLSGEPNKFYSNDFISLKEKESLFPSRKHSSPHHKLQITFENGKVKSWSKFIDKDTKSNDEINNKDQKSKKFFFSPKWGFAEHNGFNQSIMGLGFSVGYGSISFEFSIFDDDDELAEALMIIYEKKYGNMFLQTGIGKTRADWDTNGYGPWHYTHHRSESKAARFGFGYEWKIRPRFILRPTIEINKPFESDKSGFTTLCLNVRFK